MRVQLTCSFASSLYTRTRKRLTSCSHAAAGLWLWAQSVPVRLLIAWGFVNWHFDRSTHYYVQYLFIWTTFLVVSHSAPVPSSAPTTSLGVVRAL